MRRYEFVEDVADSAAQVEASKLEDRGYHPDNAMANPATVPTAVQESHDLHGHPASIFVV